MPQSHNSEPLEVLSARKEQFERRRHTVGLFLGPVAGIVVWALVAGRLPSDAARLSGILVFVLVYWVTEAIPLPVTAVLGAALCAVFQVAGAKEAFAPFAHPLIFLFIGSFLIARAMVVHGLDRRFALAILSLRSLRGDPKRVLLALGLACVVLSMWVSNTATTAMMLPIAVGLLAAIEQARGRHEDDSGPLTSRPYATGLLLMVAYGASVGGIATPVGTPPNLIGIAMLREYTGTNIDFVHWMILAMPLVLLMFVYLFVIMNWLHPTGAGKLIGMAEFVRQQRANLGRWTPGQRNTLVAFLVAVTLWVVPGGVALVCGNNSPPHKWFESSFPEAVSAVLAASLLFALPICWRRREFTLDWKEAACIDWGTILLFGGGLTMGTLMFQTGLAEALGKGIMHLTGAEGLWGITAAAIAMGIIVSEAASNTASANMVIPVVIAIANTAGIDPLPPALGACFGASFGFMLPVSTPPNAIVYGSGLVPIRKMIRAGVLFDLGGFVTIFLGLRLLWPLLSRTIL
ncbi:MAG: anion transporter [Armatimonadetes bacterium CG_4_10_14_3_um_filter_66_18]|nr:DASS family sodium-coupled anion symporter [Armatimonadota bacterium]PIU90914.1 MAG: anion transporter [Armatimonadetes bacterium CG06_land_8_20_14_3_00_66_21]PIX37397.1 MAG: anion transporter [Armatimonadetes bacterium CG_4_8_14_3_um_filter_66_20]PIY50072.1 MAG: anion transporter [Armatimonadetes bacterium CG_4_10_14_3_um_filter_66_18]PJB68546.1 MAG: anion transporter [Armatimonadetes bacterium CG_4_9_14_3_um_filter_66_14]